MRDNTGVKQTCPYIDNVISWLDDICGTFEIKTDDIGKKEKWCIEYLEEIRKMNSELRDIANEYIKKAEELEQENDKVSRDLNDAEKYIEELKSEIKQLEYELTQPQ